MTSTVRELAFIEALTRGLTRSPLQVNALQESDAELVRLSAGTTLAVTTDTVAEEIATGLYGDPWLAGWMAVMVNFSDIAAVGADPLGILIAETFPAGLSSTTLAAIQRGINDACTACGSHVLGGDTNEGATLQLTGTALGLITAGTPLMRTGIRPGDAVYSTGPLGAGNAYAALVVMKEHDLPEYKPTARLREGTALRTRATACMDTSDGLMATLDQLARLNGIGFELSAEWRTAMHPDALACSAATGLPPWVFLAGPHGEFELVFTVRERAVDHATEPLIIAGTACHYLGRATAGGTIDLPGVGKFSPDHRAALRNLDPPGTGSVQAYAAKLIAIGTSARESTLS
jgi:thiamine-monophosphate kinase